MPQVNGTTAVYRAGKFVKGGTTFTVTDEELPDFVSRGFVEVSVTAPVQDEGPAGTTESVTTEPETVTALPESDPLAGIQPVVDSENHEPNLISSVSDDEEAPKMRGRRKKNAE